MKQNGFAHAVLIIGLMVALVGALGFIFWQNFIYEEPVMEVVKKNSQTIDSEKTKPRKVLDIKELGKEIDYSDSDYLDLAYEMTSVNRDDKNKFVVAIYSKDLNRRLVEDAKKGTPDLDYSATYWKLGGNRAVYAYYYDETDSTTGAAMVDGVASNIINPANRTDQSKLYVGFMGPGSPSSESLSSENIEFRDWVASKLEG